MNITIQKVNKQVVMRIGRFMAVANSMTEATKIAGGIADMYLQLEGKRAKITVLKIKSNPMKPTLKGMAKSQTYLAKKKAVVAKAKKVVKKVGKK